MHLASAEAGNADFFCTCDDEIIKKAKSKKVNKIKVLSPTDLIESCGNMSRKNELIFNFFVPVIGDKNGIEG